MTVSHTSLDFVCIQDSLGITAKFPHEDWNIIISTEPEKYVNIKISVLSNIFKYNVILILIKLVNQAIKKFPKKSLFKSFQRQHKTSS